MLAIPRQYVCENCGNGFVASKYDYRNRKYCSRACYHAVPRSRSTRDKIAAKLTGRKSPLECCVKTSTALEGRVFSPEHCKALSDSETGPKNHQWGKRDSAETLAKKSAASTGPKNSQWTGGISREPYAWTFNAELKEEVRRRDGYKCQKCGAPQVESKKALAVHHIDYDKKNSDPVNLVALCNSCNAKVNKNRNHWTAFFQAMALKRDIAALDKPKR